MILGGINSQYYPVIVVVHLSLRAEFSLLETLKDGTHSTVVIAEDKMKIEAGYVYLSSGDYHLNIEKNGCFSLSLDEKVHFCRPAIDITWSTAAEVYKQQCVAVLLSGANEDGAEGIKNIKKMGGHTIVQAPIDCEVDIMPQSAINTAMVDLIVNKVDMVNTINKIMDTAVETQ